MQLRLIIGLAALLGACTSPDDAGEASGSTSSTTSDGSTGTTGEPDVASSTGPAGTTGEPDDTSSTGPTSPTTGESDGSTGPGETDTGTVDTGDAVVTFQAVYEQVLVPNGCTKGYCHGDGVGGLYMGDAASSYASLVGAAAAAPMCDRTALVVPGSPEQSILWYRVRPLAQDDGEPCAPKMPR